MKKAIKKETITINEAIENTAKKIAEPLTQNTAGKIADQIGAFASLYEACMDEGYTMQDFIDGLYHSATCKAFLYAYWKLADRLQNPPEKAERKHEAIARADKAQKDKLALIESLLDMGMTQEQIDKKLSAI